MKQFNHDLIAHQDTLTTGLIERALGIHGLIVDVGGKIQHEWFSQCPNDLFKEWFTQQMKLGRIRFAKPLMPQEHKRSLIVGLGFPQRGYDLVYAAVANVTERRYIVSEDMDFFDPTQKCANHETKEKIKRERNTAVCKYLRKHMNIIVGTPLHASIELF